MTIGYLEILLKDHFAKSIGQTFADSKCFILYGVKLLNSNDDILLTSH